MLFSIQGDAKLSEVLFLILCSKLVTNAATLQIKTLLPKVKPPLLLECLNYKKKKNDKENMAH